MMIAILIIIILIVWKNKQTKNTQQEQQQQQKPQTSHQRDRDRKRRKWLTSVIKEPPHVDSAAQFAPEVGGVGRVVHGVGLGQHASQQWRGLLYPAGHAALQAVSTRLPGWRVHARALAPTGSLVAHHPFVVVTVVVVIVVVLLQVVAAVDDSAARVLAEIFEGDVTVVGSGGVGFFREDGADFALLGGPILVLGLRNICRAGKRRPVYLLIDEGSLVSVTVPAGSNAARHTLPPDRPLSAASAPY